MQPSVISLSESGPLPSSEGADTGQLEKIQALLLQVQTPVSNDEAPALIKLFGHDECFGLAWTLLHLIETAPVWPLMDCLAEPTNEWIGILRKRYSNSLPT